MTDVIMPQMGESIAEGTITRWMKNVGDRVERDEPLFEISTDKVDAEIPAPAAGVLKEIRVPPGTTVPINTVVGVIGGEGEAAVSAPQPAAATAPAAAVPPAAQPAGQQPPASPPAAAAPQAPPSQPTAAAPQGAPPPPPQPTPAPPPRAAAEPAPAAPPAAPAPRAGGQADGAAPAAPPPSSPAAAAPAPASAVAPGPAPSPPPARPRAEMTVDELRQTRSSPVVRKIAAEHNVDIREVPGTGIAGRVTKQDILGHLEGRAGAPAPAEAAAGQAPAARVEATAPGPRVEAAAPRAEAPAPRPQPPPAPATPAGAPAPPMPAFQPGERVEIVPMSPIRRKTAEHMALSKRISAHVSTVWEVDMTRVDQLRAKYRQSYEERSGVKLTYLPFIMKATVDALKTYPILNSSVEGDSIVYKKDVHLGMAVALDWGLIVPVVRNADERNVLGLARAVNDLAERARTKRLKVEEVQGGTFTITNPGVFGSLFGTPIINQPQVAILGIGTIEKRPVVREDAIAIRTMSYFALTFDHRIVDGADADRFMGHIKKQLQEFDEAAL